MKILLAIFCFSFFFPILTLSQTDSLLKELVPAVIVKNLSGTPDLYEKVTDKWAEHFKFREIVDLSNQILVNKSKITNISFLALLYNTLGLNYWKLGELDSAVVFLEESAAVRKSLNIPRSLGIAHNNLGVLYWKKGDWEKAFLNYSKALEYREKAGDLKGVVLVLNNLGLIYQRLKYFDDAQVSILKALRIADSIDYVFGKGYSYRRLSNLDFERGDYDSFYKNANKALTIFESIKSLSDISELHNDFGLYYLQKKEFLKAIEYFEKALNLSTEIKDQFIQSFSLCNLGLTYYELKEFEKAITYSNKSLDLSLAKDYRVISRNNYFNLSNAYKKMNNTPKTLFFLEKYIQIKDSIWSETVISSINETNIKQIIKKTEESKRLLIKENELQQQRIDFQQKISIVYIILIVIILTALVLILNLYFKQRKLRRSIGETNLHLNNLNKELNLKNSELEEANSTKQKLFSIIAHDLKNPFVSIYGFAELINAEAVSANNSEISELSGMLLESSQKLVQLIDNLTKWALLHKEKLVVAPVMLDLAKEVNTITTQLNLNAELKNINITTHFPQTAMVFADSEMISTVLRNILSNAIKFSNDHGVIDIKGEQNGDFFSVSIADNGIGMGNELKERILKGEKVTSTSGTSSEKGTGIGLSICREFIQLSKGKLEIKTEKNVGSVFTISLPTTQT
ncbi:MAG: tetratricopeptide repeat protein [Ignavibacteriaceae bacterium]